MNLLKAVSISILFGISAVSAAEWQTDIKSNNPIVGKIWDNANQRFITQQGTSKNPAYTLPNGLS
ncbi:MULTISPECIES: hypothetical protein [unclassified Marinobacterium]|uniref:hypothetical protein n=1 Tax=unclassified Marinobacterium TaxID=2644139 RepID=UPI001568B2AC|nr:MULTISPECIES: hypothetical protein [unclassified Marinobacterium]